MTPIEMEPTQIETVQQAIGEVQLYLPHLDEFLKGHVTIYGGFLRWIVQHVLETGRIPNKTETLQHLTHSDVDLRLQPRRACHIGRRSIFNLFDRILKEGGFIEYRGGKYGEPTECEADQIIPHTLLLRGLYYIWINLSPLSVHHEEREYVRYELLICDDSHSARTDYDYNVNNLEYGYNIHSQIYWLSLVNQDQDRLDHTLHSIQTRSIDIPPWYRMNSPMFRLKRLYRVNKLYRDGYRLRESPENQTRIRDLIEDAIEFTNQRQERLKQAEEQDEYRYWNLPKIHISGFDKPSMFDSETIRPCQHPFTQFDLNFYLENSRSREILQSFGLSDLLEQKM